MSKDPEPQSEDKNSPRFIRYNKMGLEDEFRFFTACSLGSVFSASARFLHSRLDIDPKNKVTIFPEAGRSIFSNGQLEFLDSSVADLLALITKHSNLGNRSPAEALDKYFRSDIGFSHFPVHFLGSLDMEVKEKLTDSFKKRPVHPDLKGWIESKIESFPEKKERSQKLSQLREAERSRKKDFKFGTNYLSELELKAVGALYYIGLLLNYFRRIEPESGPWMIQDKEMTSILIGVSSTSLFFENHEQRIGSLIGGMTAKNDQMPIARMLVQKAVVENPTDKPNKLREIVTREAEKIGAASCIPPEQTLNKLIREFKSKKISK